MTRILTMLMLLCPVWAWAAPTQVTLFPDSAQIEEMSAGSRPISRGASSWLSMWTSAA